MEPYLELRQAIIDVDHIGAFSYLRGAGAVFRHISRIGRFCAIAGGIHSGAPEHATSLLTGHNMFCNDWWKHAWPDLNEYHALNTRQTELARAATAADTAHRDQKIEIGNDVWIGFGAFIRRGVTIGDGAVIGAHSVVTRDVPPYAVVAGTPARIIKFRFPDKTIERLLSVRWWDYGVLALHNINIADMPDCIGAVEDNFSMLTPWTPEKIVVKPDDSIALI